MNPNWSDYEVFMKPVHLKGQAVTLTITKATEEETHPQKGKTVLSPVLWFREMPFGLILSPTNRATLIGLYGDRVGECIGKPIVVKALKLSVAGRDKEPIRIQNVRPNAPKVEPSTGEIVEPSSAAEQTESEVSRAGFRPSVDGTPEARGNDEQPVSELDKHFGPRTVEPPSPQPSPTGEGAWPKTEAAYGEWLKANGWNGKETYEALRADAKTWLRKNPSLTWADVAMKVSEHMSKVAK